MSQIRTDVCEFCRLQPSRSVITSNWCMLSRFARTSRPLKEVDLLHELSMQNGTQPVNRTLRCCFVGAARAQRVGHCLVLSLRYARSHRVLQTRASTRLAWKANWRVDLDSNQNLLTSKDSVLPVTPSTINWGDVVYLQNLQAIHSRRPIYFGLRHAELATSHGIEPRPPGSEPGVLPLYEPATNWRAIRDSNPCNPLRQRGAIGLYANRPKKW